MHVFVEKKNYSSLLFQDLKCLFLFEKLFLFLSLLLIIYYYTPFFLFSLNSSNGWVQTHRSVSFFLLLVFFCVCFQLER